MSAVLKILFSFPVVIAFFIFSIGVVLAKDSATGSGELRPAVVKQEVRDVRKDVRAQTKEVKEQLKTRRAELKQNLEEKRKELKDKRYEKVVERIQKIVDKRRAALARLDAISEKIQSRIDKLSEKGVDVSSMQAALDACREVKTTVSGKIDASEESIGSIDFNAANAKDIAKAQVAAIHASNQALKSYHTCLVNVIKSAPKTDSGGTNAQ